MSDNVTFYEYVTAVGNLDRANWHLTDSVTGQPIYEGELAEITETADGAYVSARKVAETFRLTDNPDDFDQLDQHPVEYAASQYRAAGHLPALA